MKFVLVKSRLQAFLDTKKWGDGGLLFGLVPTAPHWHLASHSETNHLWLPLDLVWLGLGPGRGSRRVLPTRGLCTGRWRVLSTVAKHYPLIDSLTVRNHADLAMALSAGERYQPRAGV